MRNQKLNVEGYADPTANYGMKETVKKEQEADKRTYDLVKVLKYIIRTSGFELKNRIQLTDIKTGREYK